MLSTHLMAEKEEDKAYFYLCGPTWPVPDVYEALVGSLTENKGVERKRAEELIEEWKEDERYVLEVSLPSAFFCRTRWAKVEADFLCVQVY